MATGTGNLPNQDMDFVPFDPLTAEELDDLVENIEALADGSGLGDGSIGTSTLGTSAVTFQKNDFTTYPLVRITANSSTSLSTSSSMISFGNTLITRGSGLTVSTSTIVVGNDITLVRATYSVGAQSGTSGAYLFSRLEKNGAQMTRNLTPFQSNGFAYHSGSVVFEVAPGDVIRVTADVSTSTASVASSSNNFLIVEAIG